MEHQDLTKLTVPQLKALCKERNLTGYSKLNKPALLQKLGVDAPAPLGQPAASASIYTARKNEVVQKNAAPSKVTSSRIPDSNAVTSSSSGLGTSTAVTQGLAPSRVLLKIPAATPASLASEARPEQRLPQEISPHRLDICSSGLNSSSGTMLSAAHSGGIDKVGTRYSPELLHSPVPQDHSKKRKRTLDSAAPDASIKTKTARQVMPTLSTPKATEHRIVTETTNKSRILPGPDFRKSPSLAAVRPLDPVPASQGHRYASSSTHTGSRDKESAIPTMAGVRPGALPATKRFSALLPKKPAVVPCLAVALPETRTQRSRHADWDNLWLVTCSHLEFSPSVVSKLDPITFPPKISQRKKVAKLSLVMSFLDDGSVASLSKLSRLFRYSAYTSASHGLRESYTGKRLALVLAAHPPTTNFWPYLHQRVEEKKSRRAIFDKSYLGLVFASSPEIISSQLWSSPDNEKQITMAIRFLTTLHYFHVSIDHDPDRLFMRCSVVSADEVVKDGIWKIGVADLVDGVIDYYHVVEATCEVVGRAETSHTEFSERTMQQSLPLRADWTAYIDVFHSSESSCEKASARGLEQFLRWSNHEEYTHGISKVWDLRIENEGKVGEYKRVVAERYVMACVVGNSISGRAMTSSEMEQTFKGVPMVGHLVSSKQNRTTGGMPHLYLPECHLVESVHLTSRTGENLHPALAVVQTPAREYYILKDNGMQVGCEEDDVPPVWQEILGCNLRGVGVDV